MQLEEAQVWRVNPPNSKLSASENFANRRVVKIGQLADLPQGQARLLGFLKDPASCVMSARGLSQELSLHRLDGLAGGLALEVIRHRRSFYASELRDNRELQLFPIGVRRSGLRGRLKRRKIFGQGVPKHLLGLLKGRSSGDYRWKLRNPALNPAIIHGLVDGREL